VSPRRRKILTLAAVAAFVTIVWLIWPTGDSRVVGSWRHAERGWEETYRFESNGRGTAAYEGDIERTFRWHVKDNRLFVRYFINDRTAFLPTMILDWWDRLADDYSMTHPEEWEPLPVNARPEALVRHVHSPRKSNPIQLRSYRRMRAQ
jgi:hypothetical protein